MEPEGGGGGGSGAIVVASRFLVVGAGVEGLIDGSGGLF